VFLSGAIVLEAAVIGLIGMVLAFAAYAAIVSAVAAVIQNQTGVLLEAFTYNPVMLWAPLGMIALCALSGLLPAMKAYRTDVAENLAPIS
jgi:putative ABC transport system permease protein